MTNTFFDKSDQENEEAAVAEAKKALAEKAERISDFDRIGDIPEGFMSKVKTYPQSVWEEPNKRIIDFTINGLPRRAVGGIYAAGSTGKSMLAQQLAVSHSVGRDVFGIFGGDFDGDIGITSDTFSTKQLKVAYISLEDEIDIFINRFFDMRTYLNETDMVQYRENFKFFELAGTGFRFAQKARGEILPTLDLKAFLYNELTEFQPDLIFIDTLIRSASGLDENSNADMSPFLGILGQMAKQLNASVVFLHHVSKGAAMSGSREQQAGRGASCIVDDSRWGMNMSGLSEEDFLLYQSVLKDVGWERTHKDYVWFIPSKNNHMRSANKKLLMRGVGGVLQPAPDISVVSGLDQAANPVEEKSGNKNKKGRGRGAQNKVISSD